jgi:hypothetical protein
MANNFFILFIFIFQARFLTIKIKLAAFNKSSTEPGVVSQLTEAYARGERLAGWSWLTMHFI